MRISTTRGLPARWLPEILVFFLALPPNIYGQQAAPAPPPAQTKPMAPLPIVQNLKVVALAGKDEMNDLERHVMAPLVVQVLDLNDRPVEGADVVFRFPLKGPGATFAGDKTSQTMRTNGQGQAAANGWRANNEVGTFQVHATATYGNQMGEATISMSNVTRIVEDVKKNRKHKSWWSTRKFKIALIAGGAAIAAGIILARQTGSNDSKTVPPPTITITPGSPSVGGPP
jgi:hypothetical protein